MTNEKPHHEHAQDAFIDALFEQSPINIAALLRACADGELSPDQCERLEQLLKDHPHAETQHAFEEKLRDCCKRSMERPCCPQALRERVSAIVAGGAEAGGAADAAAGQASDDEAYAQRIEGAASYTRSPSFWARSPMIAVAAVLLLGVASVLIWQSAGLSSGFGNSPRNIEPASYSERVGQFVLSEHTRCCADEAAERKLVKNDIAQAVSYFSERFDRPVSAPDMTQSDHEVQFYGGGDCHVPMTSMSGHLRFDAQDDLGNVISLSLFVSPDPGILNLEEGTTYVMRSKACDEAGANLFVWVSGGVQYVLVSEATDQTCASVRSIMKAPDRLSEI
ncbi:MAG: hypothetical protein ACX94C_14975 [Phycisphaerales bacterium]